MKNIKNELILEVPHIGKCTSKLILHTLNKENQNNILKPMLTKFLKKHNMTSLQYINNYIQKLELCGFCNKNFAEYDFDIFIENNILKIKNIKLKNDMYMCKDKECKCQRRHLNPNSFEHISKRFKISLEEANKWLKEHNKSPFYLHPGENIEDYKKRQSRNLNYYIERFGKEIGPIKYKEHINKISIANKLETVIERHGKEYCERLCESKRNTLENFIKRHGETKGKAEYIQKNIKCTKLKFYLGSKKIDSKQAFNFFQKLEKRILEENICEKETIFYNDRKQRRI